VISPLCAGPIVVELVAPPVACVPPAALVPPVESVPPTAVLPPVAVAWVEVAPPEFAPPEFAPPGFEPPVALLPPLDWVPPVLGELVLDEDLPPVAADLPPVEAMPPVALAPPLGSCPPVADTPPVRDAPPCAAVVPSEVDCPPLVVAVLPAVPPEEAAPPVVALTAPPVLLLFEAESLQPTAMKISEVPRPNRVIRSICRLPHRGREPSIAAVAGKPNHYGAFWTRGTSLVLIRVVALARSHTIAELELGSFTDTLESYALCVAAVLATLATGHSIRHGTRDSGKLHRALVPLLKRSSRCEFTAAPICSRAGGVALRWRVTVCREGAKECIVC
jgi:hypothetical protein